MEEEASSFSRELEAYVNSERGSSRWTREQCACGKKRRLVCAECVRFVGVPADEQVPRLRLPLHVHVLLDDNRRKATGLHAKLLAPDHVSVIEYGEQPMPAFDPETTLVLFPSKQAKFIDEVERLERFSSIVLIDCRWTTLRAANESALQQLQHVKLRHVPEKSVFWRYHDAGDGCVSSIEALYYAFKEIMRVTGQTVSGGTLEDLLYIFALQADSIRQDYAYNPRKQGLILPMDEQAKALQQWRRRHNGRHPDTPISDDVPIHLIGNKLSRSRREKIKDRKAVPTKEPKAKRSRIEGEREGRSGEEARADSTSVRDATNRAADDQNDNHHV